MLETFKRIEKNRKLKTSKWELQEEKNKEKDI